jgi:thioredoxin-related protein
MDFREGKGIRFVENMSWREVLNLAKSERKYIFVDCFATWCGPCKLMDRDIFIDENVGAYMNANFISVRMQMDTSQQDKDEVKDRYVDAHDIRQRYNISAFPSFLFFSPEGKVVHRSLGFKNGNDFILMAKNATDTNKQYYTLLENYRVGEREYSTMPYLAKSAKLFGEKEIAIAISQDYLQNYIYKLSDEKLYSKENIEFMGSAIQSSKEKAFNIFYYQSERVDRLVERKGYSQSVINYIITKEQIDPFLWKDNQPSKEDPNWTGIFDNIKLKYNNNYAECNILNAQLRWYNYRKDWDNMIKCYMRKNEIYGIDTMGLGKAFLNNMIWDVIFKHSNDSMALSKGLEWEGIIMKSTPKDVSVVDTYSNLLYKLGRTKEALMWEEKALALAPFDKEIQDNYAKMKRGEKTWPNK